MRRLRFFGAVLAVLLFVGWAAAQALPLETAQGTVGKVEKDQLTVRPRGPEGKFGKNITLRLTGTSRVATISPQTRGGKTVVTQRDTDPRDLQAGQSIAVIYTTGKDGSVLLTAVVLPAGEK
jgi:hypothetical protein